MRIARLLPLGLVLMVQAQTPAGDPAVLLPSLPGWSTPRPPGRFGPDNLYEHINGAAEGFLECDFRELTTQVYEGPDGRSLTVERYRHADPHAAYGMYSQERPSVGRFLAIGAEGYYEQGILNFVKGAYYVKLSAFGLKGKDPEELERAARTFADQLPGPPGLPSHLQAFPREGQVAGSQRYLRRNVLGYPFLERAFTSEYQVDGKRIALWIFAPAVASKAREMLASYLQTQGTAEPVKPGQGITVVDRHHGPVSLVLADGFLLGAVGGEIRSHPILLERLKAGISATARTQRPAPPKS